ncbi:hypothetical protein [Streptomyces cacaoi]|uniref:hypothetical protein n=1 Tax=Streptomyces cacaoi TaxID=1898 RepID=UPI003F4D6D4D
MLDTGAGSGTPAGSTHPAAHTAQPGTASHAAASRLPQDGAPAEGHGAAQDPDEPPCDLVTVPARHGLEALDILRLRDGIGPVLHDHEGVTLGFLVPPGTAACWDLPGSACTQTHPRRSAGAEPPVAGTGWLVPPEVAYARATEPAELRAALGEAARTIEAAGRRL